MATPGVDGLTKAIDSVQLQSRSATPTTGEEKANQSTTSPNSSDADSDASSDSTQEVVFRGRKETGAPESSTATELPSSPASQPSPSRDLIFLSRPPPGPGLVTFTNAEPDNTFCSNLMFNNCTFNGEQPLRFDNCIVEGVTFTDCHFEDTQFVNSVLKDMTVVNIVFYDSWWMNRIFTPKFITIGREQDKTDMFEGKREGLNDPIPNELRDSKYKDEQCGEQQQESDMGGLVSAEEMEVQQTMMQLLKAEDRTRKQSWGKW
ncbi:hypothetical protein BST61_g1187 [Cercospora zeina]